jgi:outer membrane protein TolC
MRPYTTLLLLLLLLPLFARTQNTQDSIPSAGSIRTATPSMPIPLDNRPRNFEDYLVNLAWQYSFEIEAAQYEVEARKQDIQLARKEWTRNLHSGLNFNDVSLPSLLKYNFGIDSLFGRRIDDSRLSRIATFPVWQVGIGINFGDILNRKHKIKFAENRVKIGEAEMNAKRQKLRGEVLKRYQAFLSTFDILKIRIKALDAAETLQTQISSLFSVNKVKLEDYLTANKAYFDALESKARIEGEMLLKKIELEELIGIKWEQAEKMKQNYDLMKKKN